MTSSLFGRALWLSLFAIGLATWWVYCEQTSSGFFVAKLGTLATLDMLVGTAIIASLGATWRRVGLVAVILLAGQWWLVLWSGVLLVWRTRGFAP